VSLDKRDSLYFIPNLPEGQESIERATFSLGAKKYIEMFKMAK
jgi:hypothetical protein